MPKQHVIQLTGTRGMVNECDYQLDNTYFEAIGDRVISGGNVLVHVDITRHNSSATLCIRLDGTVTVPCDRCLEAMTVDIAADEQLKVVYGDHYEDDGEQITIDEREGRIDLASVLFELIAMQVPLQHIHAEGDCDEQMAGILREMMVVDNNDI